MEQAVIALADLTREHIPYRQSKLTHVLKDSLGWGCQTVMIGNIWGELSQLEETVSWSICILCNNLFVKDSACKNCSLSTFVLKSAKFPKEAVLMAIMNVSKEAILMAIMNVSKEAILMAIMNVSKEAILMAIMNVSKEAILMAIMNSYTFNAFRTSLTVPGTFYVS